MCTAAARHTTTTHFASKHPAADSIRENGEEEEQRIGVWIVHFNAFNWGLLSSNRYEISYYVLGSCLE